MKGAVIGGATFGGGAFLFLIALELWRPSYDHVPWIIPAVIVSSMAGLIGAVIGAAVGGVIASVQDSKPPVKRDLKDRIDETP